MTDKIEIKDLLLRAVLGINEEERRNRQDVLINIILHADMHAAGASDKIEDAVNYRTITKRIITLVEGSSFYLVEKMAAEIAALCLDEPVVERVTVRVEKPGALRFARSVGVEIERTRAELGRVNRAFLLLGSNIDPEHYLRETVQWLATRCRLLAVSPVYESPPVGTINQPNFLNAAVLIETRHTAEELKAEVLQPLEQELGRVRTEDKNAPRTIDLDIVLFNDEVLDLGHRHIPDPDILRFPHIARPLADLAPQYRHPESGQTLTEIAERLPSAGLSPRLDIDLQPNPAILST